MYFFKKNKKKKIGTSQLTTSMRNLKGERPLSSYIRKLDAIEGQTTEYAEL